MSSRKIYKYELEITDKQVLKIPANAKPLSVQVQNNTVCIWFVVDTRISITDVEIYIYGTGNLLPESIGNFVGTCQLQGFVWHVFIN